MKPPSIIGLECYHREARHGDDRNLHVRTWDALSRRQQFGYALEARHALGRKFAEVKAQHRLWLVAGRK